MYTRLRGINSLMTSKSLYKQFNLRRFSFEQKRDREKRHFMLLYRYVEDAEYKACKTIYNNK